MMTLVLAVKLGEFLHQKDQVLILTVLAELPQFLMISQELFHGITRRKIIAMELFTITFSEEDMIEEGSRES
jgi:hypothetical protein